MPKVSIYLPDDLYQRARARQLPLSTLTQQAIERALADSHRTDWVARVRNRERRFAGRIESAAVLAEARDEFGA